jgi:hypothetical protein
MDGGKRDRILRLIVMVDLATVTVAAIAFTGWAIYMRVTKAYAMSEFGISSRLERSLIVVFASPLFVPGAIIAVAAIAASGALLFEMKRGKRWPYLVTSVVAALAIVPGWLLRHEAWKLERGFSRSAKWADKSPYVGIATTGAIAVTVVLGLLAATSLTTYLVLRRRPAA